MKQIRLVNGVVKVESCSKCPCKADGFSADHCALDSDIIINSFVESAWDSGKVKINKNCQLEEYRTIDRMKAYPIEMCIKCPKVSVMHTHRYYCGKREILNPMEIPDWCPLKDYEGDK